MVISAFAGSSTSLPIKPTVTGVSSGVVVVIGVATGKSLTGLILIVKVPGNTETALLLSVAVNGIVTVPLKLSVGTNFNVAACAGVSGVVVETGVTPSA